MQGLLLTGPTGVGKSTAQAALREQHGFWVPRTCTTRSVEPDESDLIQVSEIDFLESTKAGKVVCPLSFGGEWYGWLKGDLYALQHHSGRAVLSVRPYPALILQALLDGFAAVWLTVDDSELLRRRAERMAARDTDESVLMRRQARDREDLVYKPCFAHVRTADVGLIASLLKIVP